jgi:transcriptional regulator
MYKVEKFEVHDLHVLAPLLEQFPFATVSSISREQPFVNHLPITLSRLPDQSPILLGHMSRKNPQWEHFRDGSRVVIAFHGPDTYVNPSWYVEEDVPTWNYIAIHAIGNPTVIEDFDGIVAILQKTTEHMNRINADKWNFSIPSDLKNEADLTRAIVGFQMVPQEIVGKFKLSQNRKREDQIGVIEGLKQRKDQKSHAIAQWMSKFLE